ncbi:hypothetical protein C8Q79DRAFT_287124 [Trametes meyenii]|nr:hypothetical protein C8Q79DRAFT_287124 [Trametes meyenii]
MHAWSSHTRVGSTSVQAELISLGHNWLIHNPNYRSVRVRYEAIPPHHRGLTAAEVAVEKIVRVLVQANNVCAAIVPCLYRAQGESTDFLSVVLHVTTLNVEVMEMVHLMRSTIPVHLYIGEPLTASTPFEVYSPEKLVLPERIYPGDPIFCSGTERVTVFGAYLHSTGDDGALYGLTAGHAVVPHSGFIPHPRLLPHTEKKRRRMRSSQLALHQLGLPLSNPAVKVVERAIQVGEAERVMLCTEENLAAGARAVSPTTDQRNLTRLRQHDLEHAALLDSLTRPHEYDVAHACAAEAIIRPCNNCNRRSTGSNSLHHEKGKHKATGEDHTHLLSWTLVRIAPRTTHADNPVTLRAHPGTLEHGAAVAMHVRDPNLERPLGPFRDGVVNGAAASVVLGVHVAREWAVFPAPGRNGARFAVRGDAGALVTAVRESGRDEGGTEAPLAMLYAVPERGPYGLVTPLTTVMRRIRDVTGLQLRFQGNWWRDEYG